MPTPTPPGARSRWIARSRNGRHVRVQVVVERQRPLRGPPLLRGAPHISRHGNALPPGCGHRDTERRPRPGRRHPRALVLARRGNKPVHKLRSDALHLSAQDAPTAIASTARRARRRTRGGPAPTPSTSIHRPALHRVAALQTRCAVGRLSCARPRSATTAPGARTIDLRRPSRLRHSAPRAPPVARRRFAPGRHRSARCRPRPHFARGKSGASCRESGRGPLPGPAPTR